MLTIAFALGCLVGGIIAWKLRGFWESRPRFLRRKKKDADPAAANGTEAPSGGGGILGTLSRTGEKIVGKGIEAVMGKPKNPKDDKEKP